MNPALAPLFVRAKALIARLADGGRDDDARDTLLMELARAQARLVAPYGRLVAARGGIEAITSASTIPALPTDVFRFSRVASFPDREELLVFRTSGTTSGARGEHHLRDLSLYDAAARAAAAHALFCGLHEPRLLMLAPRPDQSPDSSLSYMLGRFEEWFGAGRTTWAFTGDAIDSATATAALRQAESDGVRVVILGTSFAFIHYLDELGVDAFSLADGSRIMQTGGFKGRSREVSPAEMRKTLGRRFGVPPHAIIAEYGMTELSSQMYETTLVEPSRPRRLWVPGWVRATPVSPETLVAVPDGEIGILRIDDAANVESVCAIQTSDLARRVDDGVEILGRTPDAIPRGCGLAMDAILGDGR